MSADKKNIRPVGLIIMDGLAYGASSEYPEGDAILAAHTPNLDKLWLTASTTMLNASGEAVGLPKGQMGNSEVGHLNIGAGRCVYQELSRIDSAIQDGTLTDNTILIDALDSAVRAGKTIHLIGLLSDGGVHSHISHLKMLVKLAVAQGAERIVIHALLDGRDVGPRSGVDYLRDIICFASAYPQVSMGTVMGRYYGMDRDKRWERTSRAYDALTLATGEAVESDQIVAAIAASYGKGVTDEFVEPLIVDGYQPLQDEDALIMFNFRPDRVRQIMHALIDDDFDGFERSVHPDINAVCLTEYDPELDAPIIFSKAYVQETLADVLADADLKQFRVTETEKYAHLTFFFNGGVEEPKKGETRVMVPSPKVPTYDRQPEMSAAGITTELEKAVEAQSADLYIVNYANGDMVGHTGDFAATVKAVEAVDREIGRCVRLFEEFGGALVITADHGNAEHMSDGPEAGPHTAHTTNPVPLIVMGTESQALKIGGTLADIAPTLTALLGIKPSPLWTGTNLMVN
ncbi:MAG: 2,3-bisphosphoglycerate-independent phosphoglycerate mutase [Coriobacteriia bacterium]|nr:2,3-bisphosphoglycerate-independent phosphoglycerate mutase [Coriobacteriia bacterium]MCL2537270.1 2,3-bisphosphoglycerate-independent phosphoglycerate mutase [Coriobacteriia bacterium]